MSEKIKPDAEDQEKISNQEILSIINAVLDLIELKKGKSIAKIVQECIKEKSDQSEKK